MTPRSAFVVAVSVGIGAIAALTAAGWWRAARKNRR